MNSLDAISVLGGQLGPAAAYGAPTSPATARGFPTATSPGALDMYSSAQDNVTGYIQTATSPQPSQIGFPVSSHDYHIETFCLH